MVLSRGEQFNIAHTKSTLTEDLGLESSLRQTTLLEARSLWL